MKQILLALLLTAGAAAHAQFVVTPYDLSPGIKNSDPKDFTVYKNKLYFTAMDSAHGRELWVTEGKAAPVMVNDLNPGTGNGMKEDRGLMCELNGKLYLSMTASNSSFAGSGLYVYDGTGVPVLAATLLQGIVTSPKDMLAYNNKIYFTASDGIADMLFSYDPVADTMMKLSSARVTVSPILGTEIALYKDKIYYSSDSSVGKTKLFVYDPATGNTALAADQPGGLGYLPHNLIAYGSKLYLTSFTAAGGHEFCAYDGAVGKVLTSIGTGAANSVATKPDRAYVADGRLYFMGTDGSGDFDAYYIDTVDGSTHHIADIKEYVPHDFRSYGGMLIYAGATNPGAGMELYALEGTRTTKITNIGLDKLNGVTGTCIVYDRYLYFTANDGVHGNELYQLQLWSLSAGNKQPASQPAVYPNPTTGRLHLTVPYDGKLMVYDMQGKAVYNAAVVKGTNTITLPNALPAGVYVIKAEDSKGGEPLYVRVTLQ